MKKRYLEIRTKNAWEYFAHADGGSNRLWVNRYKEMMAKYGMLTKMDGNEDYIEGFLDCLNTFHNKGNILVTKKDLENE